MQTDLCLGTRCKNRLSIGGLQWHFVGGSMSIPAIAVYSLTAFIPKDIVITVLAVLIAIPIRKGINNAGNR